MATKVTRTRNAGTWTESAYWGALRSALRRTFRFWKPAQSALRAARVPYVHGRQKWAFRCADCGQLFKRAGVEIDHVIPVGSLRCLQDIAGFVARLTPEDPNAYRVRCIACHAAKTANDRAARAIRAAAQSPANGQASGRSAH